MPARRAGACSSVAQALARSRRRGSVSRSAVQSLDQIAHVAATEVGRQRPGTDATARPAQLRRRAAPTSASHRERDEQEAARLRSLRTSQRDAAAAEGVLVPTRSARAQRAQRRRTPRATARHRRAAACAPRVAHGTSPGRAFDGASAASGKARPPHARRGLSAVRAAICRAPDAVDRWLDAAAVVELTSRRRPSARDARRGR